MPALGLYPGTTRLPGLVSLPLKNMWAQETVTEPSGFALVGRPRLQKLDYYAADPIDLIYASDGVLDGVEVMVIDGDLWVDGTNEGTISATPGFPSIAGNAVGVISTCGDDAKFWDGTTFRSIAFPDSADVLKVLESRGRFVFVRADTHRYYWTQPLQNMLDGSGDITIAGASYVSAEDEPDPIVDAIFFGDRLVLAGTETIELHGPTGTEAAAWSPIVGATITNGCGATGCLTNWNNTFAWIDADGVVWAYDAGQGRRISDPGIEEYLKRGLTRLDSFSYGGRDFLRVWGGEGYDDLVFDAWTEKWSEWSGEESTFIGGPPIRGASGEIRFGSKTEGRMLALSTYNAYANGYEEDTIEYGFRVGLPLDGGQVTLHSLSLRCRSEFGLDDAPVIELRVSNDRGKTFSDWLPRQLVGTGRDNVEWRSLGMYDPPGFLGDVRVVMSPTYNFTFNVSGGMFNEFSGGRGR